MPYREKTAWLSLLAMVVTFGPYFTIMAMRSGPSEPMPNLRQLGLFAVIAIVQMLILGIGHLYLRRQSVPEARMPPDERDQADVGVRYELLKVNIVAATTRAPIASVSSSQVSNSCPCLGT